MCRRSNQRAENRSEDEWHQNEGPNEQVSEDRIPVSVRVFYRRRRSSHGKTDESRECQRQMGSPGANANRTKSERRDDYWADVGHPIQEGDCATIMAVVRID